MPLIDEMQNWTRGDPRMDHGYRQRTPGYREHANQVINSMGEEYVAAAGIPLISDAAGAKLDYEMFRDKPETRTPLNFGMSAAGFLPFIPNLAGSIGRNSGIFDSLRDWGQKKFGGNPKQNGNPQEAIPSAPLPDPLEAEAAAYRAQRGEAKQDYLANGGNPNHWVDYPEALLDKYGAPIRKPTTFPTPAKKVNPRSREYFEKLSEKRNARVTKEQAARVKTIFAHPDARMGAGLDANLRNDGRYKNEMKRQMEENGRLTRSQYNDPDEIRWRKANGYGDE